MVDTKKIKAGMIINDITPTQLASELNMSLKTFYSRMKCGQFWSFEIEVISKLLNLEKPWEIFFPDWNKKPTA